jgi:hypothetical protein
MLGSNVVVSETLSFFLSEYDAAPRSLGERLPHRHRFTLPPDLLTQPGTARFRDSLPGLPKAAQL